MPTNKKEDVADASGMKEASTHSTSNGNSNANGNTTSPEDDLHHTPRDVRLLRLIFAGQGVSSYEDHVPLQLMDFAYRYTSEVLQDAMVYNDYAHPTLTNAGNSGGGTIDNPNGGGTGSGNNAGPANADDDANNQMINNEDVRLAIAARTAYQFKPVPPKKMLMELAAERNEKPLPAVMPMWGIRLPPEKYCLTARDYTEGDEKRAKK